MLSLPIRRRLITSVLVLLATIAIATPASAQVTTSTSVNHGTTTAGGSKVWAKIPLHVPTSTGASSGETSVEGASYIYCEGLLYEPFLGPNAMVITHLNVFCERAIYEIYGEVLLFRNDSPYWPSFNSRTVLFGDNLNVTSGGGPCDGTSIYFGVAYVEVTNAGSTSSAEGITDTGLRC